MTINEKVEAYKMRVEGHSFKEIGDRFGVSRQYICQILPVPEKNRIEMSANSCAYKNISKWMLEHGCSYSKLARLCGIPSNTLNLFLTGKGDSRKSTIDKILYVTGMTYEEAFQKADNDA